jgi:hypothetical protein
MWFRTRMLGTARVVLVLWLLKNEEENLKLKGKGEKRETPPREHLFFPFLDILLH